MLFRTLTLNTWGLPISPDRTYRMQKIGQEIADLELDFVGLQELWMVEDHAVILEALQSSALQYHQYFPSGFIGSGILTLSRYPIISANFHPFRLKGFPERIWEADYYGGKGVGLIRVDTPVGPIDVYNTHVIAQYAPDETDDYRSHRAAQIFEITQIVKRYSENIPVIFFGDFNLRETSIGYDVTTTLTGLQDVFRCVHPDLDGFTVSHENPYHSSATVYDNKRIDYIFMRSNDSITLVPQSAVVTMKTITDSQSDVISIGFSDHFGVLAEIETQTDSGTIIPIPRTSAVLNILDELTELIQQGRNEAIQRHDITYVHTGIALVLAIFLVSRDTQKLTRRQFLKRFLCYSGVSIAALCAGFNSWLVLQIIPNEIKAFEAILQEVEELKQDILSMASGQSK